MLNHYFDDTHRIKPYTHSAPTNPGTNPPVNAVRGDVPEKVAGYWPCWNGKAWELKPDWRGTTYYIRNADDQIEAVTIKEIGETVPADSYLDINDVPKTHAEKEASVRAERDRLLSQADILINKAEDAGKDTMALRQYRQALRDVPAQAGFPESINWPVLSV